MARVLEGLSTEDARKEYLNGIRRLASPNAAAPMTETQLPDDFIIDPVYLASAERFVLRKLKMQSLTATQIKEHEDAERIRYLIQVRVAIKLIPQLPLILRQTMVGETIQIQDLDWEKRLMELEEEYDDETADIDPESTSARIKVRILATDSRDSLGNRYSDRIPSRYRW